MYTMSNFELTKLKDQQSFPINFEVVEQGSAPNIDCESLENLNHISFFSDSSVHHIYRDTKYYQR